MAGARCLAAPVPVHPVRCWTQDLSRNEFCPTGDAADVAASDVRVPPGGQGGDDQDADCKGDVYDRTQVPRRDRPCEEMGGIIFFNDVGVVLFGVCLYAYRFCVSFALIYVFSNVGFIKNAAYIENISWLK